MGVKEQAKENVLRYITTAQEILEESGFEHYTGGDDNMLRIAAMLQREEMDLERYAQEERLQKQFFGD